jgi:Zinc carboxypeptidase
MKKKTILVTTAILFLVFVTAIPFGSANYETKTSIINKFKGLCTSYPKYANYVSIGKSVLGKDIPMFRIGNSSSSGRIMWDSQMHGTEDLGSETGYLFVQWLLSSGDSRAKYMLAHNWFLFVPVVNIDSYQRTNAHMVNINRNFPVGWGSCGTSTKTSAQDYRGPYAASEPETRALISVWKTYKVKFYINTHTFGGPIIYKQSAVSSSLITTLKSKINTYRATYGGNPIADNHWYSLGGAAMAVGTSQSYGIQSFLWEIGPTNAMTSYSDMSGKYYKDTRVFLIALASMCG